MEFKKVDGIIEVWDEQDYAPFESIMLGKCILNLDDYYVYHPEPRTSMHCKQMVRVAYYMGEYNLTVAP